VGRSESLTHLLFVDDVLLLCFGNDGEGQVFKDILQLYCVATGMEINENKSALFTSSLDDTQILGWKESFLFNILILMKG
jgi:hypothetical protein